MGFGVLVDYPLAGDPRSPPASTYAEKKYRRAEVIARSAAKGIRLRDMVKLRLEREDPDTLPEHTTACRKCAKIPG